jgi:hypothetical protein
MDMKTIISKMTPSPASGAAAGGELYPQKLGHI